MFFQPIGSFFNDEKNTSNLNDRVDYGKRSFRLYLHDLVVLNNGKKTSNLNNRVDHVKRSC